MYLNIPGVTTRKVKSILRNLGLDQVSISYVSSLASELDDNVQAFMDRLISNQIRYVYVDATYFKVRDGSAYHSKVLYTVIGIIVQEYKEFLGCRPYYTESEIDYEGFSSL